MAKDSFADGFGKMVLGGAVGFGLYLLITSFGFGGGGSGGDSGGGSGGGRGEGRGDAPPTLPPSQPAPPKPPDAQRLSFVMTSSSQHAGFRLRDGSSKIYTVEALIARVKDGGRSDVELRVAGDVPQGVWVAARDRIKQAGITVFEPVLSSAPSVVGHARGDYGRRGSW
jgi:hypothetical protein